MPAHLRFCKGKVVPVLNYAPRHEDVLGEVRYSSAQSLTSALDGGEWSASCPSRFTPRGRFTGTHWIGGWVGPRAILDAVVKRKIPSPTTKILFSNLESNMGPPTYEEYVTRQPRLSFLPYRVSQTNSHKKFCQLLNDRRRSKTRYRNRQTQSRGFFCGQIT
jgi:hypothetical protein